MTEMIVENQSKHGFHAANLIILVLCILAVFGIGYSAFFKPSTTNKIADGATQINNYDVPKVPMGGCSMWRLNGQVYWQTTPKVTRIEDKK